MFSHPNAAGIGIQKSDLHNFLTELDKRMAEYPPDPTYKVDYFFVDDFYTKEKTLNSQRILDIAGLNDLWGQDVERAHVGIRCKVPGKNVLLMKSNTIKIQIHDSISLMLFGASDKQVEDLTKAHDGWIEILAYCKCNINEWNGEVTPQLIIEDYEILNFSKYIF